MKPQIKYLKHTKHQNFTAFAFLLCAFSLSSCKKFVEIPAPNTQLVTTSVFANNASATSAQIAIYAQMWNNAESFLMAQNMGLYADELQNYSPSAQNIQLYTNVLQPASPVGPWNGSYNGGYYGYIFDANSVISGLQSTTGCSPAVKRQLTGEALFVRAFCHFYLTNIYGAVPLVLSVDPNVTAKIARTSRVQVLQQVIADLQGAQGMLNSNYVSGSDTVVTTERVRPNKAAALALLARAYLYLGDYSGDQNYYVKADSAATAVISNNTYSLSALSEVFLKNSSEAIWQWQTPLPASFDTQEGYNFILTGAPTAYNSNTISTQLFNAFEPGDQRLTNWIGSVIEGTTVYYFPYKYKVGQTQGYENEEYTMVLRLGEQYLIRAEARARENNITGALMDLNMIRTRAGLANYNGAQDANSVLAAILHERQVELFTEWGHRWFDLERAVASKLSVNAATVLGAPGNICKYKGGSWNSNNYQLLFPVPQSDIQADQNLTQNSGY